MVEDQLARHSGRSMASIQNVAVEYTLEPASGWCTTPGDRNAEIRPTVGAVTAARVVAPGNQIVIICRPYAIRLGKALQNVIDELESGKE